MTADLRRLEVLLDEVLELPADQVGSFIERKCGNDLALRAELESLIEAHHRAEGFLEDLSGEIIGSAALELEMAARPVSIGPYRATSIVGRGGMGVVYRAERVDGQFEQEVAIKLLHLDLQSAAMQARFLAERQLLARLHHPNIARLLDGGVTDEGRAYFVMEYVDGVPITDWCRRNSLSVREILKLFRKVLTAVSYLHRNLVVHRDLKPGNILVDPQGRVKLLDFGIAKLLADDAAAPQTQTVHRLLTPAYAAPEQATGAPVTTATDVYSLGCVLYEILAGTRPYPDSADPTQPSRQLPIPPSVALRSRGRGPDPSRVDDSGRIAHSWRALTGDLDAICLMAVRPEPERRYPSVEQFTQDLERHLDERPVRAAQGTILYRLGRFARRNRAALLAGFLILTALLVGLARERSLRGAAEHAEALATSESAKAEAVSTFLADLLASADPDRAQGEDLRVSDILAEAAGRLEGDHALRAQPEVEAVLRLTLGRTLTALGEYEEAEPHLARALALRRAAGLSELELAEVIEALGVRHRMSGNYQAAERDLLEVVEVRRRELGDDAPETLAATGKLANLYWYQGRYEQVEVLDRRLLEMRLRVLGPDHPDTLKSLNSLGTTLFSQAHYAEAAQYFARAARPALDQLGELHPDTLKYRNNLAASLSAAGRYREAEPLYRAVVEGRRKVLGPDHQNTATAIHNLAILRIRQAQWDEAEELLEEAMRVRGAKDPTVSSYLFSRSFLADVYRETGRLDEARKMYEEVLATQREKFGPSHTGALRTASSLALYHLAVGELDDARSLARATLELQETTLGGEHPDTMTSTMILARIHHALGDFEVAEALARDAHGAASQALGTRHPLALDALEVQVLALRSQNRLVEAEPLVQALLEGRDQVLGAEHPYTRRALQLAADLENAG